MMVDGMTVLVALFALCVVTMVLIWQVATLIDRVDDWKRIADEIEKWCDSVDVDGDACGKPRELADRIRNLAKKEDQR